MVLPPVLKFPTSNLILQQRGLTTMAPSPSKEVSLSKLRRKRSPTSLQAISLTSQHLASTEHRSLALTPPAPIPTAYSSVRPHQPFHSSTLLPPTATVSASLQTLARSTTTP